MTENSPGSRVRSRLKRPDPSRIIQITFNTATYPVITFYHRRSSAFDKEGQKNWAGKKKCHANFSQT